MNSYEKRLQEKIDGLTFTLKSMNGDEANYGMIWDQRVDLKMELSDLLKTK